MRPGYESVAVTRAFHRSRTYPYPRLLWRPC